MQYERLANAKSPDFNIENELHRIFSLSMFLTLCIQDRSVV